MDIISRGGFFIWPILLESIIALWVIIDRMIFVFSVLPSRRDSISELVNSTGHEKSDGGGISEHEGVLQKAVGKAVEQKVLNISLLRLQADKLIDEAERFLSVLNIVAQTAPLLGLLGTVTGMIQAFIRIQDLGGQVNPSDLAGGIWEALITTAAGLIVAIPALIAYLAFSRTVDKYAAETDAAVSEIGHNLSRAGMEVV
ncbi:MAG TPA: MotA/TolQ/ExbB proton channel family protein [bacterium]|jgi:biopolymer transport protein ExbB